MPEWRFIVFWNFLPFFIWIFKPGWIGTKFGTKIFSLFLDVSHPSLDRNNARMTFYNFLKFFSFIYVNFLARVGWKQNSGLKFFSLFLGLSHPTLDRNNAGMMFLNFFAIFLLEFSSHSQEGSEFRTKILFSLSQSISSRFG